MLALILLLAGCGSKFETSCMLMGEEVEVFAQRQATDRNCGAYHGSFEGDAPGLQVNFGFFEAAFRGDVRGARLQGLGARVIHAGGADGADLRGLAAGELWLGLEQRGLRLQGAHNDVLRVYGDFAGAVLDGASPSEITWGETSFLATSFRGAVLGRAETHWYATEHPRWVEIDLTGASLRGAKITLRGPQSAILVGVDLRDSTLDIEDWSGLELRHVDLRGATLVHPEGQEHPPPPPFICRDVVVDRRTTFFRIEDPQAWCPGLVLGQIPRDEGPP